MVHESSLLSRSFAGQRQNNRLLGQLLACQIERFATLFKAATQGAAYIYQSTSRISCTITSIVFAFARA